MNDESLSVWQTFFWRLSCLLLRAFFINATCCAGLFVLLPFQQYIRSQFQKKMLETTIKNKELREEQGLWALPSAQSDQSAICCVSTKPFSIRSECRYNNLIYYKQGESLSWIAPHPALLAPRFLFFSLAVPEISVTCLSSVPEDHSKTPSRILQLLPGWSRFYSAH